MWLWREVSQRLGEGPGEADVRQRPVGRIGGLVGCDDPLARGRLAAALGPGGQLLDTATPGRLVADWDCCWTGDQRIDRLED
jgi:hypothetical protein